MRVFRKQVTMFLDRHLVVGDGAPHPVAGFLRSERQRYPVQFAVIDVIAHVLVIEQQPQPRLLLVERNGEQVIVVEHQRG